MFPRLFALGTRQTFSSRIVQLDTLCRSRAISADRRGIEPDSYVFEVPEHEEAPLGPLTLNDRRGNLRKQSSFRFRYELFRRTLIQRSISSLSLSH